MFTVAVCADRCIRFAPFCQFTMDPVPEVVFDPLMAFTTGFRDVKMVDSGFRVSWRVNFMRRACCGVTVVAGGRNIDSAGCSLAMNAVRIHLNRMGKQQFMLLYQIEIFMAISAGGW